VTPLAGFSLPSQHVSPIIHESLQPIQGPGPPPSPPPPPPQQQQQQQPQAGDAVSWNIPARHNQLEVDTAAESASAENGQNRYRRQAPLTPPSAHGDETDDSFAETVYDQQREHHRKERIRSRHRASSHAKHRTKRWIRDSATSDVDFLYRHDGKSCSPRHAKSAVFSDRLGASLRNYPSDEEVRGKGSASTVLPIVVYAAADLPEDAASQSVKLVEQPVKHRAARSKRESTLDHDRQRRSRTKSEKQNPRKYIEEDEVIRAALQETNRYHYVSNRHQNRSSGHGRFTRASPVSASPAPAPAPAVSAAKVRPAQPQAFHIPVNTNHSTRKWNAVPMENIFRNTARRNQRKHSSHTSSHGPSHSSSRSINAAAPQPNMFKLATRSSNNRKSASQTDPHANGHTPHRTPPPKIPRRILDRQRTGSMLPVGGVTAP
jgi:hypothetical protein